MQFSKFAHIEESATLLMNTLAKEKKRAGFTVHNLTVGEPLVETDAAIVDAAIDALKKGETHYTPVPGIEELRIAATNWMNKNFDTSFSAAQTIVTCGGKSALNMLCRAFIDEGDEAIIIAPYWVSYKSMVEMYGGVAKIAQTSEERAWKISPQEIQALITNRTKLLFINNGSNPTGVLYSKEELNELLKVAQEHNVLVISDEVYSGLVYDGQTYNSCASFQEYKDNVIVVQSCSKHFGMTGWRVGFVFAQEELIKKLTAIQGQTTSGTSSISQWAAVAAFENSDRIIPHVRDTVCKRRDVFVQTFEQLFGIKLSIPKSAFYFFVSLKTLGIESNDSVAFCRQLLEQGNVALVPGAAFGKEGYVRFSFGGYEEDIQQALHALAVYLKK